MERAYVQLSLEDRCEISHRRAEGHSIRKIAAALDRAPSSIAREVKRNRGRKAGYKPAYAQKQSKTRRWKGSKLERDPQLRQAVFAALGQGWSPEQVAGRIAREGGHQASLTKPSTASFTQRSPEPKTFPGASISPAPKANAAIAAYAGEVPQAS